MTKKIIISTILLSIQSLIAQNPLVTDIFTADPTARVFDGKLYVYPSHDIIPKEGVEAPRFCMPDYHIYSLENGNTWKDYGVILDQNQVPWGKKDANGMWAPDCIKKLARRCSYRRKITRRRKNTRCLRTKSTRCDALIYEKTFAATLLHTKQDTR